MIHRGRQALAPAGFAFGSVFSKGEVMKITVVGAGAVGLLIAARLAAQGSAVNLVARGASVDVVRDSGITCFEGKAQKVVKVRVLEDVAELPGQDLVIIATKSQAIDSVLPKVAPLCGPQTAVVTAMNGLPWWFSNLTYAGERLLPPTRASEQLEGRITDAQLFGGVLNLSCERTAPGKTRLTAGNGLILGAAESSYDRGQFTAIVALFSQAGFAVTQSEAIRRDIWFKLMGNMTHNPMSALTRATTDRLIDQSQCAQLSIRIMREAQAVGRRIGCHIDMDPEERLRGAAALGAFRTSMLQDVQAGRSLEVESLLGVFRQIAQRVGVEVPFTDALYGLVTLLDEEMARLQHS